MKGEDDRIFNPTDSPELFSSWCALCTDDTFCQVVFNRPARYDYFILHGVDEEVRQVRTEMERRSHMEGYR